MQLTADDLAAEPRWDRARLDALPGRCRGDLLGPWGKNLARRFGDDAVARVRRRLPPALAGLAPVLTAKDWVPACAQIVVTEAICDELLAGDLRALYPLLVEDTRASLNRVELALIKTLGARRTLELAPRTFKKVHDRGTIDVRVDGRTARVAFAGHAAFGNPSWRTLQLFAQRVMLELAGSPGSAVGEDTGPEAFTAIVSW